MSAIVTLANGHIQPGPWLEFGVSAGDSLRMLAEDAPVIYGFDWFDGLPEDWRDAEGNLVQPKGRYRWDIPTNLPSNAYLVIGLFENTLENWLKEHPGPIGLVHIDCDLYSSTKFVLDTLEPHLDGTIIAFDEIRGFPAAENHEAKAWSEFLSKGKYYAGILGYQHNAGAVYRLQRR